MVTSLSAIALFTAIGVSAQSQQTQVDPKQTVTVSGCVRNESDVLKRAAPAANVGMGDEFVLTQSTIRTGTAAAPAETKPVGETPAPAGASAGKVYRVTGDQESSLKAHLGHKVEIVGSFKSEADARRELGAIGTSGKPPATAAEPTATNTPEITVTSIKMIAETCGG
jgi:hypothetical protein